MSLLIRNKIKSIIHLIFITLQYIQCRVIAINISFLFQSATDDGLWLRPKYRTYSTHSSFLIKGILVRL